jgi:hypothetical protein
MTPELWSIVLTHCVAGIVTCCGVSLGLILMAGFVESHGKNRVGLLDSQIAERMGTLNNLNKIIQERQMQLAKELDKPITGMKVGE